MNKKLINRFNEELTPYQQERFKKLFNDFLTDPQLSKENLAQIFSEETGIKIDRKGITTLMKELKYPERSTEVIRESKKINGIKKLNENIEKFEWENLIEKFGSVKIIETYNKNKSLNETARIFNTNYYNVKKALEHLNVEIKEKPPTLNQMIEILENNNYSKDNIEELYINNSFKDFFNIIQNIIGYDISQTSTYRILSYYKIKKDPGVIKKYQAQSSQKILDHKLNLLAKAGFSSREELAEYYANNISISKNDLIKKINKEIGEDVFTVKWFERHIDPILPSHRKKFPGVSREETIFKEWLKTALPKETIIITNARDIIPPRELDVYIPSIHLAIEFNGLPWHSNQYIQKSKGITSYQYHKEKFDACKKKNINLIFVWIDEWILNKDTIKELIIEKINNPNKNIPELEQFISNTDKENPSENALTKNDAIILNEYINNKVSVSLIAEKLDISRAYISEVLKRNGIDTQKMNYLLLDNILKQNEISESNIKEFYVDQDHTRKELINYICNETGIEKIGPDMLRSLLKFYHIEKN